MPSPFPGMDPFLEHPYFFPGLHGAMHFCIREALQPLLPAPYFAEINERVWVETSGAACGAGHDRDPCRHRGRPNDIGGVALATRTQPLVFEVTDDERTEMEVEIRTPPGGRRREAGDGDRGPQPGQQDARRKRPGTVPGKAT